LKIIINLNKQKQVGLLASMCFEFLKKKRIVVILNSESQEATM
jgi:hypothetical protein